MERGRRTQIRRPRCRIRPTFGSAPCSVPTTKPGRCRRVANCVIGGDGCGAGSRAWPQLPDRRGSSLGPLSIRYDMSGYPDTSPRLQAPHPISLHDRLRSSCFGLFRTLAPPVSGAPVERHAMPRAPVTGAVAAAVPRQRAQQPHEQGRVAARGLRVAAGAAPPERGSARLEPWAPVARAPVRERVAAARAARRARPDGMGALPAEDHGRLRRGGTGERCREDARRRPPAPRSAWSGPVTASPPGASPPRRRRPSSCRSEGCVIPPAKTQGDPSHETHPSACFVAVVRRHRPSGRHPGPRGHSHDRRRLKSPVIPNP